MVQLLVLKLMKLFHTGAVFKKRNLLLTVLGMVIGIVGTLFIPAIRYTHFVEPIIKEIKPQQAYINIQAYPEKYIFIDVRTPFEYLQAHASTSISMPINTLYDKRKELPMNTDQQIYLICTSGKLAGVAYAYLEHYGFRNIHRVEGGLQAWSDAGLPVQSKDLFAKPAATEPTVPMLDIPFKPVFK